MIRKLSFAFFLCLLASVAKASEVVKVACVGNSITNGLTPHLMEHEKHLLNL